MDIGSASILIVDDEPHNRRLLEALLSPEGYKTRSVGSGEQALLAVADSAPDLILLDVMMPGLDGYAVARALKQDPSTSSIPIIMITAQSDRSARLAGLDSGAEDFLTKPIDRGELWLRVRNLLRLKAYGALLENHSQSLEAEVQARTAELQRFRAAMDSTADAIVLVDRATMRVVEANATACAMLGYDYQQLLATSPAAFGSATIAQLALAYDAIIAGETSRESLETELRRSDGSVLQVEVRRHAQRTRDGWIIVAVIRDITERREAQQRLHHLAHYDALTGLPNRALFSKTLKHALALATTGGTQVAVMFLDLDQFKNVNDRLGHAIGDELLTQVGSRLVQCLRQRDTIGRLGGDEFGIMLPMHDGHHGAALVAEKIRQALKAPFLLQGHELMVTVSIGITVQPQDASDPETLLQYADTAMYRAKQAGRDTARFFTPQMNVEVADRIDLETALRRALDNEEFLLHYQPKVEVGSGRIAGLEAMLRWNRPGHGLVSPNEFIPVLEETGMIVHAGAWVIASACRQLAAWSQSGLDCLQVSVNVSGRQFTEGSLQDDVIRSLTQSGIAPSLLELELTESSLMEDTGRTVDVLNGLKKMGVKISIDDFGTGYSSLAYLRRFPIDKLKIDIAFIRDITSNADDATIALAIIRMAQSLKLEVIAEGVETEAQVAYLQRHGCDQIQGFYYSPPLPVAEIEQLIRAKASASDRHWSRPRPDAGADRATAHG